MIRHLSLMDVGPARDLSFGFSPRLNVLTGDNGLGKSFVLDVLWWVLTTTWAGEKAFPFRPPLGGDGTGDGGGAGSGAGYSDGTGDGGGLARDVEPGIQAVLCGRPGEPGGEPELIIRGTWRWDIQEWARWPGLLRSQASGGPVQAPPPDGAERPPPSLVLYARVDGSYAVFDAYYALGGVTSFVDAAVVLSPSELWDGKEIADPAVQGGKRKVIGGLVADWVSWQLRPSSPEFAALRKVLATLSTPAEPLAPSEPTRVHLRDRRDIPTLATSYGVVPVTLASAGMKRALSLAYLLVWAWAEHEKAAKASRRMPTRDVVLLIDEPELHQHPSWQRAFLPALLQAVGSVAPAAGVQVFAATHSPLVLASLEPHFDPTLDTLLDFNGIPHEQRVVVQKVHWRPRGDVSSWLTSEVFDLAYARSREAEAALKQAVELLDRPELSDDEARVVHRELHRSLGDTDPFWARWLSYARARGIAP